MKYTKRIEEIVCRIPNGSFIADVGCDHGETIACAYEKRHIRGAQAIDNKEAPLSRAKVNLSSLPDVIFSCSSGLDELTNEADVIVITGLGGRLVGEILAAHPEKLRGRLFILSPQHKPSEARKVFGCLGLLILDEDELICDGHNYVFIVAKGVGKTISYSEDEIEFGPVLMKKRPSAMLKRLRHEYDLLSAIEAPNEEDAKRLARLEHILFSCGKSKKSV